MQILMAGLFYFALLFGTGFLLGSVRILWTVPRFGARMAELMETPIMFIVIIFAARSTVRRFTLLTTPFSRLAMGRVALVLLLIAEIALVLWLRGLFIDEYLASQNPVLRWDSAFKPM